MSPHLLSGAARLAGSSLLRLQSDERLVALVRDGHDPAFAAIVDRYRAELERYAGRVVGASRAEDVLQQAFLSAHVSLRANDNAVQLRPWLYRIVHNAGLNVLRSSRAEAELDERLAAPSGLEHDVEARERLRAALAAISRLPEPQRDALTLRAIEGRSHAEIAEALGVTAGAARQHVHRARTTVRAAVSAITPYGLMVRLAMAGTDGSVTPLAAGAGAAATVAKVSAGLLAAGAIGVGATHLPLLHPHHRAHAARPATARSAAAAPAAAPAANETAEVAPAAPVHVPVHRHHLAERGHRIAPAGEEARRPVSRGEAETHSSGGETHRGDSHSGPGPSSGDGGGASGSDDGGGGSGDVQPPTSGGSGSDGGATTTTTSSGDSGGDGGTTTTSSDSGSDGGGTSGDSLTSPSSDGGGSGSGDG